MGIVELKINSTKLRGGRQKKYATIYCNDPQRATYKVFLSGDVRTIVKYCDSSARISAMLQTCKW